VLRSIPPGSHLKRGVAALLATLAVCLAANAAPALAVVPGEYEVDSIGEQTDATPGDGVCLTSVNTCTLRAAIETANEDSVASTIHFKATPFNGEGGSTIELTTPLPLISQPVNIDGGVCGSGPCSGIKTPSGYAGLDIRTGETTVEHLAFSGGSVGIRLIVGGSSASKVFDNTISGAFNGIEASGATSAPGNLIEGNVIKASEHDGLAIVNGANRVYGNEIDNTGFSAIYLNSGANGNQIGGDTTESENVLNASTYSAIALILPEGSFNEIARNRGESTSGPFILVNSEGGPGEPNGGIEPPTISSAVQTSASGSAEPGAKVRVFEAGPLGINAIEGFLGEAVAGGDGTWKASFPEVPVGTLVTATQTLDGGTSELTEAVTATAESSGGGETGGGGNSGGGAGGNGSPAPTPTPSPAPNPPDTKIKKGPKEKTQSTTATFKFTATVPGSSFECKLDKTKFKKCKSPKTYKSLKLGKHLFRVRAVGPTGLKDGSAAKLSFKVIAKR
jgi:hypothetical protein